MDSKPPGDWYIIGSQKKIKDPLIGHPAMKGRRWQIDYAYPSNGYDKMKQAEKEASKYKNENNPNTI
jgi:hypothetical protein